MQNLRRVQFHPIFLKVLLANPTTNHPILLLHLLELQRVVLWHRLIEVNMDATEKSSPLHHLVLCLPENDL